MVFERYSNFDVESLEAVQMREQIISDIGIATPAATFTGTLDEFYLSCKDAEKEVKEEEETVEQQMEE